MESYKVSVMQDEEVLEIYYTTWCISKFVKRSDLVLSVLATEKCFLKGKEIPCPLSNHSPFSPARSLNLLFVSVDLSVLDIL